MAHEFRVIIFGIPWTVVLILMILSFAIKTKKK